ncbi:MAG: hypothetical protein QGI77_12605, partial [Roseibacillus sp.]|nr:hypothetical protein [Roseibacillus sp.]
MRGLVPFLLFGWTALVAWSAGLENGQERARPDVLFIAIDDMNDWISLLDPESPIRTPNLERLARRGV